MMIAMFVFALVDALAKYLTSALPALQISWLRWTAMFSGVIILLIIKGPHLLRTTQLNFQIARGATAGLSALFFIFGLSYVPLADAVAMTFVAPILVTVMATVFLGEKVAISSSIAVIAGFLGVLLVIKPGLSGFQPWLILPFVAAVLFAVRQIISRFLGEKDSFETTTCYTAIVAFVISGAVLPFVWQPITSVVMIVIMVIMSTLAAVGELLVIKSLNIAQAAAVTPVHYTLIVWSTMYGYVLFGNVPDYLTCLGAAIIIAAGFFIMRKNST